MSIYSGHGASHLREDFCELAYARAAWRSRCFLELAVQLWNCSDIVPGDVCECLDEPMGSSYAQVVRSMKVWLDRAQSSVGSSFKQLPSPRPVRVNC